MQATISITSKWQVHIPKAARKALGIKKPGKVEIKASKGKLVLSPVKKSILDYAGKYHYLLKASDGFIRINSSK